MLSLEKQINYDDKIKRNEIRKVLNFGELNKHEV